MSGKTFGLFEIAAGVALEFIPGLQSFGTPLIIGGLASEAAIYFGPSLNQPVNEIQGTIIQTDAWAQLAYGQGRYGGVLAYLNTAGQDNKTLDMVVAHTITDPTKGIEGFGDFWLNDNVLRVRTATAWAANTAYAVGDSIVVTAQNNQQYAMVCVTLGTSGAGEPVWQEDYGAVTDDNTVQWKNVGGGSSDWTFDTGTVGSDGILRAGSAGYAHGKVAQGIFSGMVELWAYDGTQTAVDSVLAADYGAAALPWASTAIGKGVVYTHWRFTPTPTAGGSEQFNNAFGGSIPRKLEATIYGEKIYDPRTAATAYGTNPALVARDFLTRDPLNGGCGIDASFIDDTNATNPSANVCDQDVTYADGTSGPRFTCSGVVKMGAKRLHELKGILASMSGFLVDRATSANNSAPIAIFSGSYSSPVGTIDESFLRASAEVTDPTQDMRYNLVNATFKDANNSYQSMSAPPVPTRGSTDYNAWVAEDGGYELDNSLQLDFVVDADHAQIVAGIMANQSRYLKTIKLECKFKAIQFNVFDRVHITNSEIGWSSVICRITRMVLRPDLGVDVYLTVDDATVWGSLLPSSASGSSGSNLVTTTPPTPSGVTATGFAGGVRIDWTAPDPNQVSRTNVWYSADGGTTYTQIGTVSSSASQYIDPLAQGSTGYYKLQFSNGYQLGAFSAVVSATSSLAQPNADQTSINQSATVASLSGHTLTDLPDGSVRLALQSALQQAVSQTLPSQDNLLLNGDFNQDAFWDMPAGFTFANPGLQIANSGDSSPFNTFPHDEYGNNQYFRVHQSQQSIYAEADVTWISGTGQFSIYFVFYDETLTGLSSNEFGVGGYTTTLTSSGTAARLTGIPAGAVYARVVLSSNAKTTASTVKLTAARVRLGSATLTQASAAQVGDGTNLIPLNSGGYATSYWTSVVLSSSYNSTTGKSSASATAGTLHVGQTPVNYNSWSVSGLSADTTYFFGINDPTYAGGTPNVVYSTNLQSIINNNAYNYAGTYTTASSSGGGTGNTGGCVALDMLLRPDVHAGRAHEHTVIDCADQFKRIGERTVHGMHYHTHPCVRIVAANGAALVCSVDTPFTIEGGASVLAPNMTGQKVITDRGVSQIISVDDAGSRPVAKISVGGLSYAAGEDATNRIYSHNSIKQ